MDANRKRWNEQQQALQNALVQPATHRRALQDALARPTDHQKTLALFFCQHAMVHTAPMSELGVWSFEDEVWQGVSESAARRIPPKLEHSLAWIFWHIARIEDATMNLLVAGGGQVFEQDDWRDRLQSPIRHTGNAMDEPGVMKLSAAVDLDMLRAYRIAVGRRTRDIVSQLQPPDLRRKVEPSRLQTIWDQGAVIPAAREIVDYWSKRTVAGLLLMPATRHNFLHLNEALRIKQKLSKHETT
jgi:hypothetical protein